MPAIGIERRRLDAARLAGSAALAVLGQFAVDAPTGYFGPADRVTRFGLAFLVLVLLLSAVGVALYLAGHRRARVPALCQLVVVLAAFVPPLASDPVIAGGEVLWHLLLFGRFVSEGWAIPRRRSWWLAHGAREASERWLRWNGAAVVHLLLVSLVVSVAVLGYRIGDRVPAGLLCLVLGAVAVGLAAPYLWLRMRERALTGPGLALVLLVAALASAKRPDVALSLLAAGQAVILFELWAGTRVFGELIDTFYERPAHLVLVSFLLLIALGTLFLSFPAASAAPRAVAPLDALFTATSAACVTGLIVLDTPNDFSTFGLVVILCLIQLGGLNIMVLSAFAAILLGRGLGFRGEGALGELLDVHPGGSAQRLVLFIVAGTLSIESVGALLLWAGYTLQGHPAGEGLWFGVFHAVSAFCNAGFSLHADSLIGFAREPLMLLVVAVLITLGGLGFSVLASLVPRKARARKRSAVIQARLVLLASGLLVLGGTIVYAAVEWNHTLDGLGAFDRLTNAVFQSATLRTAGFNSVDFDGLRPETTLMMMGWMFIGASPGGTGGGIKTTTALVLLGSVLAILARRERVVLFRHRIPLDTVYRSAAIAVLASVIVFGGTFALLATQKEESFELLLFECFSAFGTVGLSLGVTPRLDAVGKLIVALMMLVGRVGPLTLALLLGRRISTRVGYPEARVMVG